MCGTYIHTRNQCLSSELFWKRLCKRQSEYRELKKEDIEDLLKLLDKAKALLLISTFNIFQNSVRQEKLPTPWKLAIITPSYTSVDKWNPSNYISVSLTSVLMLATRKNS